MLRQCLPLLILLLFFLVPKTKADCPGCGLAVLIPVIEVPLLDVPSSLMVFGAGKLLGGTGRLGPTYVTGLWGGAIGFLAGSMLAYPFLDDGFTSILSGGLGAGIPLGILTGNILGFKRSSGEKASAGSQMAWRPIWVSAGMLPQRGTRINLHYGF